MWTTLIGHLSTPIPAILPVLSTYSYPSFRKIGVVMHLPLMRSYRRLRPSLSRMSKLLSSIFPRCCQFKVFDCHHCWRILRDIWYVLIIVPFFYYSASALACTALLQQSIIYLIVHNYYSDLQATMDILAGPSSPPKNNLGSEEVVAQV